MRGRHWLNVAALATWLVCGVQPLLEITSGTFTGFPAAAWLGAFLVYGAALIVVLYRPYRSLRPAARLVVPLIADALGTAEGTAKNHISSILSKLGVRDRTRAVLKALELGYF